MKKFGFFGFLFLFMLVFPGIGHAGSVETHINLDGRELAVPKDAQVQIVNGSVMVPLKLISVELGYNVTWDNTTKTATIEQAGATLKLIVNNNVAEASGRAVQLDNPPFLSGQTTFVPLKFVGQETGAIVGWDNISKTVYLTSPAKIPADSSAAPATTDTSGGEAVKQESSQGIELTNLSFNDNKLSLALSGGVTPSIFSMTGKDRIVIDLPNTAFAQSFIRTFAMGNKQNGTLAITDSPDISAIRYSLFSTSPSVIRIVMDINSAKTYDVTGSGDGMITIDLNGTGIIDLSGTGITDPAAQAPAVPEVPVITLPPLPTGRQIVVIDAGHGGKDPGGISVAKRKEKDFTLSTTLKIAALLENDPNIEVVLTRSDDTYPTLQDRAKLANDLKARLFVSIHANSIAEDSKNNPSGTETYYTRTESLQFAKTVHKYLIPATGLADRGVRQSSLHVTRETKMPAILLECGYLSNASDEALLYTDLFQQKVAEAVVSGIKEYLGLLQLP